MNENKKHLSSQLLKVKQLEVTYLGGLAQGLFQGCNQELLLSSPTRESHDKATVSPRVSDPRENESTQGGNRIL